MKQKTILLLILTQAIGLTLSGQNFWRPISISQQNIKNTTAKKLDNGFILELNHKKLVEYLRIEGGAQIDIPLPDGSLKSFTVQSSAVMESGLATRYPNLKSYSGTSLDGQYIIKLDFDKEVFHAIMQSAAEKIYIDPLSNNTYVSYHLSDINEDQSRKTWKCGINNATKSIHDSPPDLLTHPLAALSQDVELRTYRLALACTPDWANSNGGTIESSLSAMMTSVNRLNMIFENDLAIRLILSEKNDELIFTDPLTSPYDNPNSGSELLTANTVVLNNAIGFDSYDIGHVYTRGCTDVGGVAFLGSVCAGNKGGGVSCHNSSDLDATTVTIVAHEMGHQLGANHSFNNCEGNENFGTAYEPGSGSTIMSYAGLCGGNNVARISDDYFHAISLQEIYNYTRLSNGNNCPSITATDNSSPNLTVDVRSGTYIPFSTPFILSGRGTDSENDIITYNWEQFDLGPRSDLGNPTGSAPLFRSTAPSSDPARTFPDEEQIITGSTDITEVLPTTSRELSFRLVGRDNHPEGGGVSWKPLKLQVTDQAGPFKIIDTQQPLSVGEQYKLRWAVEGTDKEPVNTQYVAIDLSINGGVDFNHQIINETENDGEVEFIIPNMISNKVRFRVRAIDNIFFDISDENLTIQEPTRSTFFIELSEQNIETCAPTTVNIQISSTAFNNYTDQLSLDLIGDLPPGTEYSFSKDVISPDESSTLSLVFDDQNNSGNYSILLRAISESADTLLRDITLDLYSDSHQPIDIQTPRNNFTSSTPFPTFSWSQLSSAQEYRIQLSTNPSFENLIEEAVVIQTEFTPTLSLPDNEIIFWRLQAINRCSVGDFGPTQAFHSIIQSCEELSAMDIPIPISASGTREIESKINFENLGMINDVNVTKIKGVHEQVSDLRMVLESPAGSSVLLIANACQNLANFDIGFDDSSLSEPICPIVRGTTHLPHDSLSLFNNEQMNGEWTLRIFDEVPGFGGQLNEWSLEVCSFIDPRNLELINNVPLEIPPLSSNRILEENMLVGDEETNTDKLVYTIVKLPSAGTLYIQNEPVELGDEFSQEDINQELLRYIHNDNTVDTDEFLFVAENDRGGWIPISTFQFSISEDFSSSNVDIAESDISIYPNPAQSILYVKNISRKAKYEIYDLNGKRVLSGQIGQEGIDISSLIDSLYTIELTFDQNKISKKFTKHGSN